MSDYRRAFIPGGCFFFTAVTQDRWELFEQEDAIVRLREGFRRVREKHPFAIDAMVVLPDHLHTIWRLPEGDADFSLRWRLIKHYVSVGVASTTNQRGEKAVWQRRFWEHSIRDEADWRNHVDYIHYNPVKHGHVQHVRDWPHSSFHRFVQRGIYPPQWAGEGMGRGLEWE
jgi:putative transposase